MRLTSYDAIMVFLMSDTSCAMNWKKCKCKKWMIAKLFLVEWLHANDTEEESTTTTTVTCKPSVYLLESCAAGRNVTREKSNDCCDSCAEA